MTNDIFGSQIYNLAKDFLGNIETKRYIKALYNSGDTSVTLTKSIGRPVDMPTVECEGEEKPLALDAYDHLGEQFYAYTAPIRSTSDLPEELADVNTISLGYAFKAGNKLSHIKDSMTGYMSDASTLVLTSKLPDTYIDTLLSETDTIVDLDAKFAESIHYLLNKFETVMVTADGAVFAGNSLDDDHKYKMDYIAQFKQSVDLKGADRLLAFGKGETCSKIGDTIFCA